MRDAIRRAREWMNAYDTGMVCTYAGILGIWLAVYLACGPVK